MLVNHLCNRSLYICTLIHALKWDECLYVCVFGIEPVTVVSSASFYSDFFWIVWHRDYINRNLYTCVFIHTCLWLFVSLYSKSTYFRITPCSCSWNNFLYLQPDYKCFWNLTCLVFLSISVCLSFLLSSFLCVVPR